MTEQDKKQALRRYIVSDEWKSIQAYCNRDFVLEHGQQTLEYSVHDRVVARGELLRHIVSLITLPEGEPLKEALLFEIEGIEDFKWKILDEKGQSLDSPIYSKNDMIRWDKVAHEVIRGSIDYVLKEGETYESEESV